MDEELRVACMQEMGNANRVLLRELFGRKSLEQENNIKCDLEETRWVAVDGSIIIFIYCNWVVTRWQWLFYM